MLTSLGAMRKATSDSKTHAAPEELTSREAIRGALEMASEAMARKEAAGLICLDVMLSTKKVYGK